MLHLPIVRTYLPSESAAGPRVSDILTFRIDAATRYPLWPVATEDDARNRGRTPAFDLNQREPIRLSVSLMWGDFCYAHTQDLLH
jgi:hypothetical protein